MLVLVGFVLGIAVLPCVAAYVLFLRAHGAEEAKVYWRDVARGQTDRADRAEEALIVIRQRKSRAVSQGNRTRAELARARQKITTDAIREAVLARKQPQREFPFSAGEHHD